MLIHDSTLIKASYSALSCVETGFEIAEMGTRCTRAEPQTLHVPVLLELAESRTTGTRQVLQKSDGMGAALVLGASIVGTTSLRLAPSMYMREVLGAIAALAVDLPLSLVTFLDLVAFFESSGAFMCIRMPSTRSQLVSGSADLPLLVADASTLSEKVTPVRLRVRVVLALLLAVLLAVLVRVLLLERGTGRTVVTKHDAGRFDRTGADDAGRLLDVADDDDVDEGRLLADDDDDVDEGRLLAAEDDEGLVVADVVVQLVRFVLDDEAGA